MPKSMERDKGQLFIGRVIFVVAIYGVLKGLIRCTVIHHLAVVLDENPGVALPIVAHLGNEGVLGFVELFKALRQKVGDRHGTGGCFCLGGFTYWLTSNHCNGFADLNKIFVTVYVFPL